CSPTVGQLQGAGGHLGGRGSTTKTDGVARPRPLYRTAHPPLPAYVRRRLNRFSKGSHRLHVKRIVAGRRRGGVGICAAGDASTLPGDKEGRRVCSRRPWNQCRQRPTLPRSFPRSTIGGSRLNFRVRNGNGCDPAPVTTGKPALVKLPGAFKERVGPAHAAG